MRSSWSILATAMIFAAAPLRASQVPAQGGDTATLSARRSMVTRSELQTALDEIDRGLSSSAYSSSLRSAKKKEADAIRVRLQDGDFRSGDEIKVDVLAEPGLSAIYTVTPARTILLPANFEVPMNGVLRSEVQAYLTKQLTRYVNEPNVTASASVRIAIFGAVSKPGFYNVPANLLLSNVLQTIAMGPAPNADLKKSQILRNNEVIVDGHEFNEAVYQGRTLDQMNIQAGDVIQVAAAPATGKFLQVAGVLSGFAGLILLIASRVW